MNKPNMTIMDSAIKEDFNGNHTRPQGKERLAEKSIIQEQWSIFWSSRIDLWVQIRQKSWTRAAKRILENIPSMIDHFLSVTAFLRFSRYGHLGFCAKDRSLAKPMIDSCETDCITYSKLQFFQIFSKGPRAFLGQNVFFLQFFKWRRAIGLDQS